MFHKYIHGLVPIGPTEAFQILPSKTRGDCLKIVTKPYTKDVRCNSFFVYWILEWPQNVPDFSRQHLTSIYVLNVFILYMY
jgi:hypothetical protein